MDVQQTDLLPKGLTMEVDGIIYIGIGKGEEGE
jgi:hypothetical protein